MKKGNWTNFEERTLREELDNGTLLKDIAQMLSKSETAVYLYCYRNNIPLHPRLKNPMMRNLLQIKFGKPEFFQPNKAFYRLVGINQKRWSELACGYVQPTQDELMRVAKALNFSVEETFKLMDSRQLDLFAQQ